ncbi:MAG: 2-oxo-4-hydroxy-4-carboxy-5-ureidoimidazoline decarboxylase [Alphaproteobacteria bacterium]|nr:2-oxo-4-hydroxy-4-carboxy-5-ureidoimidazoline decarboxylase [Alphaproteobacteria bacterium]
MNEGPDKPLSSWPASQNLKEFTDMYGGIYEHAPWVAEAAYVNKDNISTVGDLHHAMQGAVDGAPQSRKLELIKAHPDLACQPGEAAGLTAHSQEEQRGAGLMDCTPEEFEEFQQLNAAYKEKFGFPFVIAVKELTRGEILAAFRQRIDNDAETEFNNALEQIHKITWFRLMAL